MSLKTRIPGGRPPPPGGLPPYIWAGIGGSTALVIGTYYAFVDEVPFTKRRRWIATSPQWEQRLGDGEYKKLLAANRKNILPPDHRASTTVRRVGERLAQGTRQFCQEHNLPESHNKPYTYTVLRSDTANAFVLPGNHVFVMTGLFRYIKDEDDLAAVLGHETAHNLARHVGEKLSGNLVVNLVARLSLLFDPSGFIFTMLLPAANLFRELPNSRQQEMEADQIGVHLAAQSCFDPRAAPRVFRALKDGESKSGGHTPEFLSTHPSHDKRISKFDDYMPQAMNVFQGDFGDRCASIRKSMSEARRAAAFQAQAKENRK